MNPNLLPNTIHCSWAKSPEALREVFRLRYQCYRRTGAIPESAEGIFSDPFDLLPNHFSFLLSSDEEGVLATVRISVVTPERGWTASPAARVFADDIAFQTVAQRSYVEASRLCFQRAARRDVLYRLLANMVATAGFFGVSWLVACPRVEHSHMYKRQFGFRQLSEPRQYFGVQFQTDLLGSRLEEIRATAEKVPSMRAAWAEAATFVERCLGPAHFLSGGALPCPSCNAPHLCGQGCPV